MKLIMEHWRAYLSEGLSKPGFDVNATAGVNELGDPNIDIKITIDGNFDSNKLYLELIDVIVHEMTHLGQSTFDEIGRLCGPNYFACLTETEAFTSGLLARADEDNQDISVVMDEYLQAQVAAKRLHPEEVAQVKSVWLQQLPKLNKEIEAEKRLYAADAAPQIVDAAESQMPVSDSLFYIGYKYIAETDETDQFTIDYEIEYI